MVLVEAAILLVALLLALYKYGTRTYDYWKVRGIKYKKPMFPFVGNSEDMVLKRNAPADAVNKLYNYFEGERFGGVFQFRQPILLIRDPELIRNIVIKDFDHFHNRNNFIDTDIDPLFGKSLVLLQDQQWKDMRNTLSPVFTSSKMKSMFKLMANCGEQVTNHLDKTVQNQLDTNHKDGAVVKREMKSFFNKFTNDVIATSAFGIQIDSMANPENDFYKMGNKVSSFGGFAMIKFFLLMASPFIFKLLRLNLFGHEISEFFRKLVHGNIKEREEKNIVRPDLIHLLMQARKGTLAEDGTQQDAKIKDLSDDDITAQALVFFFAGFETVAVNLSFAAHEIAVNPDVQSRLQEEIDSVIEEDKGVTYEGVMNKMKYLEMVVSEVLRMWSPAILSDRSVSKKYTIPATETSPEVILEKGSVVWIPIFPLSRSKEFWDEPEKFDPERFNDENKQKITPFTYIPFGSGPRNCIGNRFALMETKICLLYLLKKYSFKVIEETQIPLKLSKVQGNVNAEKGFWVGLEPRKLPKSV